MSMRDHNHMLTICEVLRCINDRVQSNDPNSVMIRDMLALAERMGKSMMEKLHSYSELADPVWWEKNPEYGKQLTRTVREYRIGDADAAARALALLRGER
jgi:hypothetical protein